MEIPSQPLKTKNTNSIDNEKVEEALGEKKRIERLSRVRQIIFGSMDGLLVPLGVVSGVAGGTGSTKAVIVAGLAEAFAGALSMGVGEYISGETEAQVQQAEINKEVKQIQQNPAYELQELVAILESEGVRPEDATVIATRLQRNPQSYVKTMVEKELGLDVEPETVKIPEALTIGISYIIASIVPLIAYFFLPISAAFWVSLVLTLLVFITIGVIKGKLGHISLIKSVLQVLIVGTISGMGGYFLGQWIPHLFGY